MQSSLIWRWFARVPMPELYRLASILTIVNASYQEQLDASELVACLSDFELAKQHSGHVSSFLGEVPVCFSRIRFDAWPCTTPASVAGNQILRMVR